MPHEQQAPSDVQVDELDARGWVRVASCDGKGRIFAVTSTGRQAWREHVAERDRPPGDRVELDWPAARDLLERIYDKYRDEGAPPPGVRILSFVEDPASGRQAAALVRALARDDYLEIAWEGPWGPGLVIPLPKTVRMLDGWPADAAHDSLNELVAALNSEIDRTTDPDKQSKLRAVREGLVGAARDIAIGYIEKKVRAA